ncbi:hypothetical protein GO009_15715 [Muricauda sp. TY007]|uniref:hypothetical protein n=1 Tax=Allomuricauda sp. TY007 TaxID=2683200 RepID=UPI0013C0B24A|nr:hypothetical protein [Muricauda sp. TY007]NDV17468.1 hypothetical protein [Muricauda sp. TY007]
MLQLRQNLKKAKVAFTLCMLPIGLLAQLSLFPTWDEAIKSGIRLMPEEMAWDSQPPSLPNAEGKYPIPIPGKTKVL